LFVHGPAAEFSIRFRDIQALDQLMHKLLEPLVQKSAAKIRHTTLWQLTLRWARGERALLTARKFPQS